MVCTNETQKLNMDYNNVFQPDIASRIDELILSKSYSSWPVCDSIGRDKKIHQILSDAYCDLESPESQAIQKMFDSFSMTNDDWTPDTTQRIYLFHSRGDDYVPIQSARPMIRFLKDRGFKPSIIPGRTNLQTNFIVRNMGHLSGTLIYYIQTLAAIKAWPMMYTDNQLNPIYKALVSQKVDIVMLMRQLDAMGFDCRALIRRIASLMAGNEGGEDTELNPLTIYMSIHEQLQKLGISEQELLEMAEDSGIDLTKFIADLITYFIEQPAGSSDDSPTAPARRAARLINAFDSSATPAIRYEEQLRDWLGDYLK